MYWKRSTFRVLLLLALVFSHPLIPSLSANSVKEIEGGDFTLQSKMGPVTLSELRGKVVLLFFGYTSCPNVCPVSLNTMTLTFNKMTPLELEGVQALFISLDPDRDTLEMLKTYVEYFHPKILGVTAKMEQVKKVT
ncbi:MAG: SCO family protein, partial [Proteobacteria bacterium]|nr:SCO family protein [Pseudomonadota bacterium]